jgi:hypothetical protein
VENNVLRGYTAMEAMGWAEQCREELEAALRKKQLAEMWGRGSRACVGASSSATIARASDERMLTSVADLVVLARELLLLLKIAVAMLFFLVLGCVVLIVRK